MTDAGRTGGRTDGRTDDGHNQSLNPARAYAARGNNDQSIVDSGTTDVFLPETVFAEVKKAFIDNFKVRGRVPVSVCVCGGGGGGGGGES